jgi:SAM-dependent methyltransferase
MGLGSPSTRTADEFRNLLEAFLRAWPTNGQTEKALLLIHHWLDALACWSLEDLYLSTTTLLQVISATEADRQGKSFRMPKPKADLSRMRPQSPSRTLLRVARRFSREFPILDAGCGFGRNSVALAELGFTVICADHDLYRLDALMKLASTDKLEGALFPVRIELGPATWPFAPACFSAVVFVHYLDILLFPSVHHSLAPGGSLYLETVGGQGGNYLELPHAGEIQTMLSPLFRLDSYEERPVGPAVANKCVVKLLARKC